MDFEALLVFAMVSGPLALYFWYVAKRTAPRRKPVQMRSTVRFGKTQVRCRVAGKHTFVEAPVPERRGVALWIEPHGNGHRFAPLRETSHSALSKRITPDLVQALIVLGDRFDYVQAGPAFVSLEIRDVVRDPVVLDAAIRVVGALAQPAPARLPSAA